MRVVRVVCGGGGCWSVGRPPPCPFAKLHLSVAPIFCGCSSLSAHEVCMLRTHMATCCMRSYLWLLLVCAGCWKAAAGPEGGPGRASWCQIEVHCVWDKIISHAPEGERQAAPGLCVCGGGV